MNIVRGHTFSLHIQQLFQILDLSLEFTYDLHILPIELHWLHFHYDLYYIISTCLARYTNFRVFIVSSILFIDGEMLPTIKVKVLPVRES